MVPRRYYRRRRRNPQTAKLHRELTEKWAEFEAEPDADLQKAHALFLMGILDEFINEPELLPADLQPGALGNGRKLLPPSEFNDEGIPFIDSTPFDEAGSAHNLFFFYADSGQISHLHPGPVIQPTLHSHLMNFGPHVHVLEKRYASRRRTQKHMLFAKTLKQLFEDKRLSAPQAGRDVHLMLFDPAGCKNFDHLSLGRTGNLEHAKRAADELAEELNIRFVVATIRRSVCTR